MGLLDKLVCVRLIDEIKGGKLKALRYSLREKDDFDGRPLRLGEFSPKLRFTVHFSLNYPYTVYNRSSSETYSWEGKKYGVLIPLKSLIESGQTPVNIHSADTFFLYEVRLTKDTMVVEQPNIQNIQEEISRMGFPFIKGDIHGWKHYGEGEQDEMWELARKFNATSKYHEKTIFGRYEEFMKGIMNWRDCFGFDLSEEGDENAGREAVRSYLMLKYLLPRLPERMKIFARKEMKKMQEQLSIDAFVIAQSTVLKNCDASPQVNS